MYILIREHNYLFIFLKIWAFFLVENALHLSKIILENCVDKNTCKSLVNHRGVCNVFKLLAV